MARTLRFLANMNISPQTVQTLQQNGWDTIRVSQVLPVNAPDREILDYARSEGRVVVTQDLDFSALLALGGHSTPSLITLRLLSSDPQTVSGKLLEVFSDLETSIADGCAVTIEDTAVRVRRLPIE
ncbi:MAG: DUF5615 family PIN-like protein [Armatimonadetes bacterium]|nr:DUF5615 family PIN-like protein [Armatimonadota bacterium]